MCVTYGDAEDRRGLLVDETLEWDVTPPPTAAEVEEDVTGGGGGLGRIIRKNKAVCLRLRRGEEVAAGRCHREVPTFCIL